MKRLLIGSNNKTKKLEKAKAIRIVRKHASNFTYDQTMGSWDDRLEKSLAVDIEGISTLKANKLARELREVLKQEAVMVQDFKTSYKLIK